MSYHWLGFRLGFGILFIIGILCVIFRRVVPDDGSQELMLLLGGVLMIFGAFLAMLCATLILESWNKKTRSEK